MTPQETIKEIIRKGDEELAKLRNQVEEAKIMDRLGKRLMIQGDKFAKEVAYFQSNLSSLSDKLKRTEEIRKHLVELEADLLKEAKGATV